ncbi:GPI transamidase component PIG-S [Aspergillus eucalypticola CBS 122712]|uniref:GPI transamidase component PIG-S n=1 Tax=Aspergillus eucalypticola (strain CBS 122712 / IBT 29274) TaxID=1448314 RepID=A0A317VZR7_ASPEC|nr:GPI transamidase component PIG-S [Aspergillus eucalypticola CBS 122712]PWY79866.1 GPI transamidase component PIG-S [Aspergillus eucalypticola CBS 122712]
MTRPQLCSLMRRPSMILLLALIASTVSPTQAFGLLLRSSDSCPSNYNKCADSKLPDDFCCSSSSTCISLDDSSSAICCPSGQSCDYIETITCDVQLQNATAHPKNSVKTTRLDDSLPKCGDKCCPFGYTCTGDSLCAMNTSSASTLSASQSSTTSTTGTTSSTGTITSFTTSASTSDASNPTIVPVTTGSSKTAISDDNSSSTNGTSSAAALSSKASCPSYPTNAIIAGFFPGAIFGAVLALLALFLYRKHQQKHQPPSAKVAQFTRRSSKGTLIGISSPIPSDETSYRTDFLLRRNRNTKRYSEGARSRIQRTGTRVRSLFNPNNAPPLPKANPAKTLVPEHGGGAMHARVPVPVPPLPISVTPLQPGRTPSKKTLARTESIRVYTPPGVFATTGVLKPEPYPTHIRTEGTFDDMEK